VPRESGGGINPVVAAILCALGSGLAPSVRGTHPAVAAPPSQPDGLDR
jgi:hypothetical protein